jgi:ATP-dependent DNA ligase
VRTACTKLASVGGACIKHRLNSGQELVIGGYAPGGNGFDALIVGYDAGKDLRFVAKVRNGFMPEIRREIFKQIKPLVTVKCPFVNLPELKSRRWGAGLTERMHLA